MTRGGPKRPQQLKSDPDGPSEEDALRELFISLFADPKYESGITNSQMKALFPGDKYRHLVPIINTLTRQSRLTMSAVGDELIYNLVSDELAQKMSGLDVKARMVYQVIEKAGNKGIWSKEIRIATNMTMQDLTKLFKNLEQRKLIKQVKSVTANKKKFYMLYDLTPAKEITGGPWYTEMEFDHEFISSLRTFIMELVKRLNDGKGVTLSLIAEKMKMANVSRVELNMTEVQQLLQTLAFDYMIEQSGVNQRGEAIFIAARKVSTMCEFTWWDVLCTDFHFRDMKFEDDVVLSAHEPHHHTAS
jgi:DNA-directed RNA polymerase III subunit RPC6